MRRPSVFQLLPLVTLAVLAALATLAPRMAVAQPASPSASPGLGSTPVPPPEETFFASGAQKVRFKGQAWMGWAGDLTDGLGFPNQFFINRINIRFEGNLDEEGRFGFRVRLETGALRAIVTDTSGNSLSAAIEDTGGGFLFIKQAYFQVFRFLLADDKLQIGATALPWIPFAEDMFGYRILRASAPELWGYQGSSDIGITHYLFLEDKLVTVQYGIWNGDYTAKGIDAFGDGENVTDYFKTVGVQVIFRDRQTPFRATVAFMLQSGSGDDARLSDGSIDPSEFGVAVRTNEDGFRAYGGVFYKVPKVLTIGLTFGLIAQRGPQDALSGFASFMAIVNLSVVAADLDNIEVVFRFDANQLDFNDPTRGEPGDIKFRHPDGSLRFGVDLVNNTTAENGRFLGGWEFGITFGLAIRVHSLVTIVVPVFKGDYSDARRDTSIVGAYVELKF